MLALTGGNIFTMVGDNIENGTVLIKDGNIIEIGESIAIPSGTEIIRVNGRIITPGLIDAHSHIGMFEEIYRVEGDDGNEMTDPLTPHLRAIDAVNPEDLAFQDALKGGVTTVVTGPGSANILGGEMAALKTWGKTVEDMIVKFPIGLKAALGENPKRVYGTTSKAPHTRMASAAILREALVSAQNYIKKQENWINGEKDKHEPERDLKLESIGRVLKREIPLRVHAHRADDIMTAVRIAREFDLKIIIEHCTEGYKVADELARLNIPAIIGPIITNRAKVELQGINLSNGKYLEKAGVNFAIMTDHPVVPIQYLALSAGLTVQGGLSEKTALQAITVNAAKLLGLNGLGTLEKGQKADLVVWSGHPFDLRSKVELVYINCNLLSFD
ncbi:amidohydrolase [Desulfofarcimen acetoxidans DSM 771]|uniref:Amidohydrolase n=1 Tax=Desulfofarcimen acetoxidans (strain ATCC 49208 / DSM 771 / KCTC 5769 / VKM B-1644 / 5575) TaxID=485916 RepID=C8VWT5_DESAS|nr:amidohydrolase [Desulfofarcimen acetoxidans]ACV64449.1 amidohydrolase [Desulfofarcimen acetoxidans DSM 771]